MSFASAAIVGYFFGFALGVGCALAVMYSIYTGGYRKAVEDSLRREQPERFRRLVPKGLRVVEREQANQVASGPDSRL